MLPQITRLAKLMYLTEVEYFRQKRERLTGISNGYFICIGPYPVALQSVLGEPEIEDPCSGGQAKTSKQIVPRRRHVYERARVDFDLEVIISRIVKDCGETLILTSC